MRVKNTDNMVDLHKRAVHCPLSAVREAFSTVKIPLCEHGANIKRDGADRNMAVSNAGAEVRELGDAEGQKRPK